MPHLIQELLEPPNQSAGLLAARVPVIPKANSGFTQWNLFFYSITSTGIIPKLYPVIFCTTWGVFVSFNIAPLLDKDAFRCLATRLKIQSMMKFHVVYNLIGHCMPCIFLMVFPPTSLNAMHLKCPLGLIAGEGSIIKTVLKSLTYSSKEERLFALNATLDKLSLREINRVIEEDLDFIRSEEEQEFLDLLLKKKQQMIDGTSLDGETIKAAKNSLKEDAQKLKHYTSV